MSGDKISVIKTDKEKLEALLTEFGVEFTKEGDDIICYEGNSGVRGYRGFFTGFAFTSEGKFIYMGAFE